MEKDALLRQASLKSQPDCPEALKQMIEERDYYGIKDFIDSTTDKNFKVNQARVPEHLILTY